MAHTPGCPTRKAATPPRDPPRALRERPAGTVRAPHAAEVPFRRPPRRGDAGRGGQGVPGRGAVPDGAEPEPRAVRRLRLTRRLRGGRRDAVRGAQDPPGLPPRG